MYDISCVLAAGLFACLHNLSIVSCCDRKMADKKKLMLPFQVLYMDAIEYFPDQLQETLDLMTEKELRVRVPVEELDLLLEV